MSGMTGVLRGLALLVATALLAGCASSEVVASSGPRPPTSASMVKIYEKPPKKYEVLGTVTATRAEGAQWGERSNADQGFDTLISKSASLGANGLLLQAARGEFPNLATAGYRGAYYQVPVRGKSGDAVAGAQAIYVHEE